MVAGLDAKTQAGIGEKPFVKVSWSNNGESLMTNVRCMIL